MNLFSSNRNSGGGLCQGRRGWLAANGYIDDSNQFSRQLPNDKTKFTPSKPLRECITERLTDQQECLDALHQIVDELEALGKSCLQSSSGKGPGDEQIGGEKIAQVKVKAKAMSQNDGTAAATMIYSGSDSAYPGEPSLYEIMQMDPSRQWRRDAMNDPRLQSKLAQISGYLDDSKDEDPLRKYCRLENEIRLLANLGTVQSQQYQSNPYQAQADQYESLKNPSKAMAKRLREVLGDGSGGGEQKVSRPGVGGAPTPAPSSPTPSGLSIGMPTASQQQLQPVQMPPGGGGG